MRTLVISAVVVIAVGGLVPLTATAQTIRLKNGNTLHGEVKYPDEHQVIVDIPGVGKLTFHKDEIAAIEESPDQASWQEIPPPEESRTHPSRKTGNSQRQAVMSSPHYAQAKSLYQQGQYEQAEAKAQRALESALQSKDTGKVEEMKGIISACRKAMSQQKDTFRRAIDEKRIERGMTKEDVRKSWGSPIRVETTGSGEKWVYGYWERPVDTLQFERGGARAKITHAGHFVDDKCVYFDAREGVTDWQGSGCATSQDSGTYYED